MKLPTPREIAEKQQDLANDCFIGVREDVARLRSQGAGAAYAAVEKALREETKNFSIAFTDWNNSQIAAYLRVADAIRQAMEEK